MSNTIAYAKMQDNVLVKAFLTDIDFRRYKSKHKYVLLWSTKFHRLINKILRTNAIDWILANLKYTRHYFKKMVLYFYSEGNYKHELQSKGLYLYRGLDKDFKIYDDWRENGFMSTSLCKDVASSFAGKGGNILTFTIAKLPSDVPFVIIDEQLDDCLAEKEILFLPGVITTKKTSTGYKARYKMSSKMKDIVRNLLSGGGSEDDLPVSPIPDIRLNGKYIVWYRAINGRKVEVVGRMEMPKRTDEACKFFNEVVLPHDDKFDMKTNFIPHYQDLKKKGMKRTPEEQSMFQSYFVQMAVYDPNGFSTVWNLCRNGKRAI